MKIFSCDGAAYGLAAVLVGTGCGDLGGLPPGETDSGAASDTAPGSGTGETMDDEATSSAGDGDQPAFPDAQDANEMGYRSLDSHPGCSLEGLAYEPAQIEGYRCAAKEYAVDEDPDKPIVLLIHGNSDSPLGWQRFDPMGTCDATLGAEGSAQLAEILTDNGFRTIAVDMRIDLIDEPDDDNDIGNAAKNMDHGWGVPITQHFIQSVHGRPTPTGDSCSSVFSFGVTTIRDALRRLAVQRVVRRLRAPRSRVLAGRGEPRRVDLRPCVVPIRP